MSSRRATPYLFVNLGCEYIFLLENRLRGSANVPPKKADEVIVDCTIALFEESMMDKIFVEDSLDTLDNIKKKFYLVGQSPSLRINEDSLDKLFTIICMVTKMQLHHQRKPEDMFDFVEKHFTELRNVIESTSLADEVSDAISEARKRFRRWYADISLGEFQRMRMTLASFLHSMRTPVLELVKRDMQHRTGYLVAPTHGEPVQNLGDSLIYDEDGATVILHYNLQIAGKELGEQSFAIGINLFAADSDEHYENRTVDEVQPKRAHVVRGNTSKSEAGSKSPMTVYRTSSQASRQTQDSRPVGARRSLPWLRPKMAVGAEDQMDSDKDSYTDSKPPGTTAFLRSAVSPGSEHGSVQTAAQTTTSRDADMGDGEQKKSSEAEGDQLQELLDSFRS